MDQKVFKKEAAKAALAYVPKGCVLGVGTGSTTMYFIQGLKKGWVRGAVPSSKETERALRKKGIRVLDLNQAKKVSLYVDGADEVDPKLMLIKGGGGALTREKIIATAAKVHLYRGRVEVGKAVREISCALGGSADGKESGGKGDS